MNQGRIQDFKLGGGRTLKNCAERREALKFLGYFCEKSRFYAKKYYFFQLRREARTFLGYFVWKITILRQKIIFFPIVGGARARCAPLWIRPCELMTANQNTDNRHLKFWHWKKVRSTSEKVKKWKIADISPKIFLIDL